MSILCQRLIENLRRQTKFQRPVESLVDAAAWFTFLQDVLEGVAAIATCLDNENTGTLGGYQMALGGNLDTIPSLPVSGIGSEIVSGGITLTRFRAVRGTAGTSGTTTIQLEVNGVPIAGAILSWVPINGDDSLKTVSISVPIIANNLVSFRLTSRETGAVDIIAGAN